MNRNSKLRIATTLMVTVSGLSLAGSALAGDLIYSSAGRTSVDIGARVTQTQGLTQVRLDNGATVSILDRADYRINADGTIDLYGGSVTVTGGDGTTVVRMPEGVTGEVAGRGSSGSFSVADDGEGRGHVLTGSVRVGRGGNNLRQFTAGEMFAFSPGERIAQVVSNGAQATPGAGDAPQQVLVADMQGGGPVAAAVNGVPVTLGDALAAAGASGDVIAAARRIEAGVANPAVDTFPAGDLGLLVASAAGLENAYGGTPFNGAQADIIRTYLGFLADGGSGAEFLSTYAGLLVQYLDLVRQGGAPSGFGPANLAQINSFITYTDRTGGFGSLSAQNRVLVEAYLQFIYGGGNPDLFAGNFTDVTEAYFAFLRSGGNPLDFAAASQSTLDSYIAFLADSGLVQQLAVADRALVEAYLANGGAGFAQQYRSALGAYFDFLAQGRLPSSYTAFDQATLQSYLATLEETGLLTSVLGNQADFYASYLAYLRAGGAIDGFAGLPANIFAGYTTQLDGYFAFLAAGNLPSDFTGANPAQLQAFIAQLQAAGALDRFLGNRAAFFAQFSAFVAGGGNFDLFPGLNANIFAGYAQSLGSYFAFLDAGGLPSTYTAAELAVLNDFLAQLAAAGALDRFLGGQAGFFEGYLAFLQGGGQIDSYAQLNANIFTGYASALSGYFTFLDAGGLPSAYTAAEIEVLNGYLAQLAASGALDRFLGGQASFFADYLAFVQGGGVIDSYAQLNANIFTGYASALSAYYDYLLNGGVPSAYGALTQDTIADYLAALAGAGATDRFLVDLAMFYTDYFAFLAGGGNPDTYAGLPVPPDFPAFAAALNAYASFLASGGLPSDYTAAELATLQSYLQAIISSGQLTALLGANGNLLSGYFDFLAGGGTPDAFGGLPVYADYVTALNAYYAFLTGGGLPGDYTALDQATIRAYLDALNAAGGLVSFGSLDAFFGSYFAYLQGGGAPGGFTGLPVYADYVTALNAYFAFLAGGGLPSDYTALDQATIAAYLTALSNAGGFASYGDLNAFFVSYFAFVQGGGDPATFGGLPIYADYVAALNAYYAFLAGGGAPSGYTALDQATIEAYLAALSGVSGGLTTFGDLNGFFAAYYDFVIGGGDPDQFAGLPTNGGGGMNSGFAPLNLADARSVVQTDDFPRVAVTTAEVDGEGRIQLISGTQSRDNLNASGLTAQEYGRFGDSIAWTRYTNGTQSIHAFVATPMVTRPASGTVDYQLIGGTAPTDLRANPGETGTFSGTMQLSFSSSIRMRLFGRVELGGRNLTFQTPVPVNLASDGTLQNPSLRILDNGNVAGVSGRVYGGLFGQNAEYGAYSYRLDGPPADDFLITGVAVFGVTGNALTSISAGDVVGPRNPDGSVPAGGSGSSGGGNAGGGNSGTTTTTRTNQNLAFANLFVGDDAVSGGSVTVDAQGRIVGYQSRTSEVFALGSASIVESGADAGVTWSRWANGTPSGDYYGTTSFNPLGANGGWHVIAGDALTNMPASGTLAYDLTGFTTPTRSGESTSTGSITGSAAVLFGAAPKFGLDLTVISGSDQINMRTDGGVTDVSQSRLAINSEGVFNSGGTNPQIITTNLAGTFCATGCLSFVQGFLSGDGATGAGLSYAIRQEGVSPQGFINGTAAFARGAPIGSPPTGTGFTGTRTNQVYYTYLQGSLNSAFGGSADLVSGNLTSFTSALGTISRNDTTIVEAGDVGEMAWARWTNGTVTNVGLLGSAPRQIGANGGYHVMSGTPTVTLPSSGKVDYALTATTSATDNLGSTPGTISGALAIQFGSTSLVGYNLNMAVGGRSWGVSTPGGAADPGSSNVNLVVGSGGWTFGGAFTSAAGTVTATGGACAGPCFVNISGAMYGDQAKYAGVAMNVVDGGAVLASGLAIFTAQTSYNYNPYASAPAGIQPNGATISRAPAAPQWDRWSVPAEGRGQGIDRFPGAGSAEGIASVAAPAGMSVSEAEAMLGGLVTFSQAR